MSVKGNGKLGEFKQSLSKPRIPSPETSHWFWNPSRVGVTFGPSWFRTKLHDIDPELEVTWDRCQERWLIWLSNPKLHSKLCNGWSLLFPVKAPDGSYQPLDERIFARIYGASARRWDSAKCYFDAIEREWDRDRELAKKAHSDHTRYSAGEYYDFMKIKNIGSGSKFANHFSG